MLSRAQNAEALDLRVAMGAEAVCLPVERLSGATDDPPHRIVMQPMLIVRESCAIPWLMRHKREVMKKVAFGSQPLILLHCSKTTPEDWALLRVDLNHQTIKTIDGAGAGRQRYRPRNDRQHNAREDRWI